MEPKDKVIVITGGGGGIGSSMARAFLREGAQAVVISDLDNATLEVCADALGCDWRVCDVTDEWQVKDLVDYVISEYGRVDVYCSNAGAAGSNSGVLTDAGNEVWQKQWDLHVMAHVYASRALLPSMIDRGDGYFLITSSAAGLLAATGSGPYTVTKAAAIKFAECLQITHGDDGIGVSVLCPQGVATAMAPKSLGNGQTDGILEPDVVAAIVIESMRDGRFHVLPHPEVAEYVRRKGDDIDRWLGGMRRLRRRSLSV